MLLEARTCFFWVGMESSSCLVDLIGLYLGTKGVKPPGK